MVPVRRPWPQESHATDQEQCTTGGLHPSGICEISAWTPTVVECCRETPHVQARALFDRGCNSEYRYCLGPRRIRTHGRFLFAEHEPDGSADQ